MESLSVREEPGNRLASPGEMKHFSCWSPEDSEYFVWSAMAVAVSVIDNIARAEPHGSSDGVRRKA